MRRRSLYLPATPGSPAGRGGALTRRLHPFRGVRCLLRAGGVNSLAAAGGVSRRAFTGGGFDARCSACD